MTEENPNKNSKKSKVENVAGILTAFMDSRPVTDRKDYEEFLLASIAVSAKRIADFLEMLVKGRFTP
jgi:hypothetical protein